MRSDGEHVPGELPPREAPVTEPAFGEGGRDPGGGPALWPSELDPDYELLGELGRGGMAVVFRARDRALQRDVAIKVVQPRLSPDAEAVSRLAREARTVAQLQHPNIVGVYAIRHLSDGSLALVMQLVPGRTLKAALEAGPFDVTRAEHVLRDVARALAYAHKAGVVHRDVKPENIFLDEVSGRAMLSDFGVARVLDAPTELTATGTTIGTPTYMAPEQIDGFHIDGRSDLYSLGMVGWEMLTGARPWSGETLYNVIYRQKHDFLAPLDEFRKDVSPTLQYLLEGLMQKNPDRRWSSAGRFLALLSSEPMPPGFREWQSARRRRRRSATTRQARGEGGPASEAVLQTVKFDRQAVRVGSPADAPATTDPDGALKELSFEQVDAIEPVLRGFEVQKEVRRESRFGLWLAAGGMVLIASAGALWFGLGLPARDVGAAAGGSVALMNDRAAVEVPVASADSVRKQSDSTFDLAAAAPPDTLAGRTVPDAHVSSSPGPLTPPRDEAAARKSGVTAAKSAGEPVPNSATARTRTSPGSRDSVARIAPTVSGTPPPVAGGAAGSTLTRQSSTVNTTPVPPATPVRALIFPVVRGTITAGSRHSCLIGDNGRAACWGNNESGQLGDGSFQGRTSPEPVVGDFGFTQIAAGAWHTCGVTAGGELYCWGKNDSGQLGDGTTSVRAAPVHVNSATTFQLVRTGAAHTCALSRAGIVFCWGANAYGQLGDGTRSSRTAPVPVPLPATVAVLAVGWNHTCALTLDGIGYCWGENRNGQLGDGSTTDRTTPVAVATDARFISIAAGSAHSCGVAPSGMAYCWGQNNYGQLGTGTPGVPALFPRVVDASATFLTVVAGSGHSCARTIDGRALCWGRNAYGQLGDGTTTDHSRPVAVTGLSRLAALHASGAHTCAITTLNEAYCWGYNVDGQLGGGDRENAALPTRVVAPR